MQCLTCLSARHETRTTRRGPRRRGPRPSAVGDAPSSSGNWQRPARCATGSNRAAPRSPACDTRCACARSAGSPGGPPPVARTGRIVAPTGKITDVRGVPGGGRAWAHGKPAYDPARGGNECAGELLADVHARMRTDPRSKRPDTGSGRRPLNALFLPRFRVGGARSAALSARNLRRGDPQPARL